MSVSSSVGFRRERRDLMSRLEISTPEQFPVIPDSDVLYEIHADITDPNTGESFKDGAVIAWDHDHQNWVNIGSPDTDEQQLAVDGEKITLERGGEIDLAPILAARAEDDQQLGVSLPDEKITLEDGGEVDLTPILDARAESVDRANGKFYRTYFKDGVQMHEEIV